MPERELGWLRGGGRMPRRLAVLRPYRRQWYPAPVRIVQVLLRERRAVPHPWVYLASAALGISLGVVLDLALGWPWWIPAAVVPAVVWLVFLSTAIHRTVGRRALGVQLARAVAPRWGMRIEERRLAEMLANPPFPLYGVDGWTGQRFVAGWGGGERGVSIALGHSGSADPETLDVRVEVSNRPLVEESFADEVDPMDPMDPPPVPITWERRNLVLDGGPATFRFRQVRGFLPGGRGWVAVRQFPEYALIVEGLGISPGAIRLVKIGDPEPYLEGWRALRGRA